MVYITKHCPNCNGELQVPVDLKCCICMYCGESFSTQEEVEEAVKAEAYEDVEAAYRKALADLPLLVNDYERMLILFTRDKYAACFAEFEQEGLEVLQPAEAFAGIKDNKQEVSAEIARYLFEIIERDIEKKSSKKKVPKGTIIDQHRFFQTVYLVPMISRLNYSISEPIVDALLKAWIQKYPKYPYQKSDYGKILEGFQKKGFCFITTAVCEMMNKSDDCYELTVFRYFRDTYMMETKERKSLVEEYYRIAPIIVTTINMNPESEIQYQEIWVKYLQPCLKALEKNRLYECENLYSKMVKYLKKKYYFIAT